jgi:hypothetical protein
MTTAQRTAIAAPGEGLLVYDTQTFSVWVHKNGSWSEIISGGGSATGSWSNSGTNIYNSNTGNVGIGTSTPIDKLTIQTPLNSTGFTHIGGANEVIFSEFIGGVSAGIGTSSNHALRFNTNGTGKLSIYPAGEVVVGGNAAGAFGKFTVVTGDDSYGMNQVSNGPGAAIIGTYIGGTSAGIGTYTNTNMRIFCNNASTIFIAAATGNVGIGTNSPGNRLEVNGTIRSKEIIVETNGWPDYVFDKNHQLPTLPEIEKFIQQNQHLPGFPSALEIEKNGLTVGYTQKKMMEKIEELTLYIIELNKKVKILEAQKPSLQNN